MSEPPSCRQLRKRLELITANVAAAEGRGAMEHAARLREIAAGVQAEIDARMAAHAAAEARAREHAARRAASPPICQDQAPTHADPAPEDETPPAGGEMSMASESPETVRPKTTASMDPAVRLRLRAWSYRTPRELAEQIARSLDHLAGRRVRGCECDHLRQIAAAAAAELVHRSTVEEVDSLRRREAMEEHRHG